MAVHADIEIRPDTDLTAQERAEARDAFVRSFERQFADWTEIAKVCIDVERDKDYLRLGFDSWHLWILKAAPMSRSYIYIVTNRYKELEKDIPADELRGISLGSAKVLESVSSKVRRDSNVRKAAKKKPKDLRAAIKKQYPDQHIEGIVERKFTFTFSQWEKIEGAYEAYLLTDEGATFETFIEWMVTETTSEP
jgi:hypothetical protein